MNRDGQPFRRLKATPSVSLARQKRDERITKPLGEMDWGRSEIIPGKGKKDGNCNRTACQAPLEGRVQYFMDGNFTGGPRLYYCKRCSDDFTSWDRLSGSPIRCQLDETTVPA